MRITIKELGLKTYLDRVYPEQGGYDEFVRQHDGNWPKVKSAKHFNVNRRQILIWSNYLEAERG